MFEGSKTFFFLYCTVSVTETLDWVFCLLQEATDGRGVDVIVEMLSNVNLGKDLQLLAYGGRVTVCTTSVFFVGVKNHSLFALNMANFTLCVRVRVGSALSLSWRLLVQEAL